MSSTDPEPTASQALTTVWLARHGHVHNPNEVLYGRLPRMRLSEEGQRQARALAAFLADRPLAAIYSSPMLRARKTAAAVQRCHPNLPVRIDRDLLEVMTSWQGQPEHVLRGINFDYYANRRHETDESLEDLRDRTRRWLARVLRRHPGEEVVGVTHGDPTVVLVGHLHGKPMDINALRPNPYLPTGSVYRLQFAPDHTFVGGKLFVPHADLPRGEEPDA